MPIIDEVRYIANITNASLIGISKTKLDKTILLSELKVNGYDLIRLDRSRSGDGLACYIKSSINQARQNYFVKWIRGQWFWFNKPRSITEWYGLACYIKSSIAIVAKTVFAATSKVFLFDIYLAKSKPILLGILYRPPDKLDFVKHQ